MDSGRRQVLVYAVVGFLVGSAAVVAAAHITGTVPIDDGVTLVAPDGMEVTVDGQTRALLEDPFTLGGTVNVETEAGNATFYSPGNASATIHKDDIEGTWTNVTAIEANANSIQINPDDKQEVTVAQETTAVAWTATTDADDGTADFSYSASGPGEVTLTAAPASTTLYAVNSTGYILDKATSDSSGTVTFDALASGDHDVRLQTNANDAPQLANAEPQGDLSEEPTQFSVDVSDPNFDDGDSVTVTIDFEGSQIHSETITSNQTVPVSAPAGAGDGGSHDWSVEATDDYGGATSAAYSYNVPSSLTFRHEQPPHDVIEGTDTDPIRIEATFYEDAETDPVIVNRTTTTGTIDLDGLPVSSEFSVSVKAPGYHNRSVRLDDIYAQSEIFLIEKGSATTVENRFIVNDRTGEFPPEETEILIQAPVNQSIYASGGYDWLTVSGDDLGADQAYVDDLIEGKRYRIAVQNDDGDTRILGSYTPETAGTIELNIGSVRVEPADAEGVAMNATWINATDSQPEVRIAYNDTANATDTLYVDVYERNNESNTLIDNESFSGPFGTFTLTEPVPADENDTTWVVEVRGDRSGDASNVHFKEYVGPSVSVLTGLPSWLVTVIFVGLIWAVAGLFSQVNGHVGGIVVAGLGAMLFFVGLVPGYLGGGVVALSLLTAGLMFVRESRAGGL